MMSACHAEPPLEHRSKNTPMLQILKARPFQNLSNTLQMLPMIYFFLFAFIFVHTFKKKAIDSWSPRLLAAILH